MKTLPNGIAVIEGDTHASRWIEEQGKLEYDPTIEKVLMPYLKPGDTALDIGAMLGAYAHGFKRAVGVDGRVLAFEPNPETYACLVRNCPGVGCYNLALGSSERLCSVRINEDHPNNYGACEVFYDEYSNIKMQSLDEFWKSKNGAYGHIKLIKVDVEGMEPEVIQGGIGVIRAHRPVIFIEINHRALFKNGYRWHHVVDPLTDIGYRPKFIGAGHNFREQDWPEMDVIFEP